MAIIVEPVQRYQKVGDKTSPQLYYLKRKANNSRLYNTKRIAQEIEELGGMSAEDVEHVVTALVRNIKRKLTDGDSVKLDGLGVFYTTFHSKGTASSEECTVKNIDGGWLPTHLTFKRSAPCQRLRSHHQRQPQQRGVQPLQPQRGRSLRWRWQRQR
jgi:predicted histone-like DNA-binding protein